MESYLPSYNDPLFSIILLVFVGFVVAVGTYLWDMRTKRIENDSLLGFLDKFESKECVIDTKTLPYEPSMLKPLSLLAKSHEMSGEYHKAISLYLYLAKSVDDEKYKYALMEHLGDTYAKAGLLERAKGVYLDILSSKPRSISVLYALGDVYQMLHDFPKAIETTVPLKTLGEDTTNFEAFLSLEMLLTDRKIPQPQKIEALVALLKGNENLYRQVFAQMLVLDNGKAWDLFEPQKAHEIIDILWFRDALQIDTNLVQKHEILKSIYYAKGHIDSPPKEQSGIFALDMIVSAKQNGNDSGVLKFGYICNECKHNFVSYFKRCPNCKGIYSVKVEEQIGKKSNKTNHSLL